MVKENLTEKRHVTAEEVLVELRDIQRASLKDCPTYLSWRDQETAKIEKLPDVLKKEKEQFELILRSARLLSMAGRTQSARYAYEDALFQAQYSTAPDIQGAIQDIENEMKALPDGKGITERPLDE